MAGGWSTMRSVLNLIPVRSCSSTKSIGKRERNWPITRWATGLSTHSIHLIICLTSRLLRPLPERLYLTTATVAPIGAPVCEVSATAKRDLKAGEVLDGVGEFMTYGLIENAPAFFEQGLLPMGVWKVAAFCGTCPKTARSPMRSWNFLKADCATDCGPSKWRDFLLVRRLVPNLTWLDVRNLPFL